MKVYGHTKKTDLDFQEAREKVEEELQKEGFGILTEINVKAVLKKKLDVNYDDYVILGACNPPFSHKALEEEKEIGLLLPCNVIVYRKEDATYVSAILPRLAMSLVDNPKLESIAAEVQQKLKHAIDSI